MTIINHNPELIIIFVSSYPEDVGFSSTLAKGNKGFSGLQCSSPAASFVSADRFVTPKSFTGHKCAKNDLSFVWINQCCKRDDSRSIGVVVQAKASTERSELTNTYKISKT